MSQNDFSENFKFPDFIPRTTGNKKNADYAHICFIRKYRDHTKKTRYIFKSPGIDAEKVSNVLLTWLTKNYEKIDFDNISKYNAGVTQEINEWTNLNDVSAWSEFLNPINHDFDREISQNELDKMDDSFAGIMIFCQKDGCVYGQITRLKPRFVLNNSEGFLAILNPNNNKFISKLQNEKGFRISSKSDILFNIDSNGSARALIFSKQQFEDIFDLSQELKQNAIKVLYDIELFVENSAFQEILHFVEQDRTVQKMLNNRVFLESSVKYLTFNELKHLKKIAGDILLFEISEDGNDFVLPDDTKKGKALRQIIKAISRRYIVGEDGKIFMENAGITEIWDLFKKDMEEAKKESNDEDNYP